jgi:hypothetical protein
MLTICCLVFVSFSLPPHAETSGYSAMNFVKSSCDFAKLSLDMQSTIKDVLRTKHKQSELLIHDEKQKNNHETKFLLLTFQGTPAIN